MRAWPVKARARRSVTRSTVAVGPTRLRLRASPARTRSSLRVRAHSLTATPTMMAPVPLPVHPRITSSLSAHSQPAGI
jgi:hypothetical protein